MSNVTPLAAGQINASDQLVIELVQADDAPAAILIRWPDQPTVSPPTRFDATAAAVMRLLAADVGKCVETITRSFRKSR